jgi:alpha-N-arabinofuranosidase
MYYLVTSTFTYFPGIPIFQSTDLINWKQIGHAITRNSQADFEGVKHSEGIFAPVIRYNKGTFYIITTNVPKGGNFILSSSAPEGPWSEPNFITDAPGIDPSLFFDGNKKAYYTGTRPAPEGEKYCGNWEIWLQELDIHNFLLIGKKYPLWRGALIDCAWPEGPHLYKMNNYYYLLISEGGTGHFHAISVARSKKITGPYRGFAGNPILTHRHLGKKYPIVNTGHGDLIETQNKEWWLVLLASRPYGGYYRNLGRETFLAPVEWEDDWPVISPGTGKLEFSYKRPRLKKYDFEKQTPVDNFDSPKLGMQWNFIRNPVRNNWSLSIKKGFLTLKLSEIKISDNKNPSFIGRRLQHMNFSSSCLMEFTPKKSGENAGMILFQNEKYNFRFELSLRDDEQYLHLIKCCDSKETTIAKEPYSGNSIVLKITAIGQNFNFYYGKPESFQKAFAENIDGRILSTDIAGGFVGTYIGMYASSNGKPSDTYAHFDWFEYKGD